MAVFLALLAGCTANRAPVVDAPVRERSAKPSVTPKSEPAKPAVAAKPGAKADGDWRPDTYTVKKGDTLYGIALDHGQDYRDIAAWNGIVDPNVISVGQTLRVRAPEGARETLAEGDIGGTVITRPVAPQPSMDARPLEEAMAVPLKKSPKAVKVPYSDKAYAELGGVLDKPAVAAPDSKATREAKASADAKAAANGAMPPSGKVGADGKPTMEAKPAADARATAETKPVTATSAPAAVPANLPGPAIKSAPAALPAVPGAPPAANGKPATQQTAAPATAVAKAGSSSGWVWPARGKVVHEFGSGPNPKGITVAGQAGEAVVASAAGKVVYSGAGLRGYGKLVIIKHDSQLLSVYAHNRELLVKEGERVQKGQKIAEMGDSDADAVGLHFEIRKLGKPVDPMPYLQGNS